MSTIVVSPSNVVTFPEGGGHFWVCMQYVMGFRALGCEVYWLERFTSSGDPRRDAWMREVFMERMERFGMRGKVLVYTQEDPGTRSEPEFLGVTTAFAESVFRRADLLLNFHYSIDSLMLSKFKRTALVDIDPGLLQFWISEGQLQVHPHDRYLTTGETVGAPDALFPDCGLPWQHIQPPVCLDAWPFRFDPGSEAFTTTSSWWGGGGKGEFIADGNGMIYENNKRVTFLQYVELPRRTPQPLELALNLGDGGVEESAPSQEPAKEVPGVTDYISDAVDREILLRHGWRLKDAYDASKSPEVYQSYVRQSRGEFSCVKPSCLRFSNAWISDRTICYLATGKPAVIQDTGPSRFLPDGEGMFRFSSMPEAVEAFETINANYRKHCMAAREIAEAFFDARKITSTILTHCLS